MARLFLVSLLLALALSSAAEARSDKRCAVPGAFAVASNREAVVLERDVAYDDLNSGTEVYGCLRKKRRPFFVAGTDSNQYGSGKIAQVALAGRFVAVASDRGLIDGSCAADVTVMSLSSGNEKRHWSAQGGGSQCPGVTNIVVSRRGLVGFTYRSGLDARTLVVKVDNNGEKLLDAGDIDHRSLTLAESAGQTTLRWVNGAERRHRLH